MKLSFFELAQLLKEEEDNTDDDEDCGSFADGVGLLL